MPDDIQQAVDNDILLKAACYQLSDAFWPSGLGHVGVLGTARFVLPPRVSRMGLSRPEPASDELAVVFDAVIVLEPEDDEVALAAELEAVAQLRSVQLDAGESQLAAIAIARAIDVLETGDKRAISALQKIRDDFATVAALDGRVVCLEQVVLRLLGSDADYVAVAERICTEPSVDQTLTICFSCRATARPGREDAITGLESYVNDLRRQARDVLAA